METGGYKIEHSSDGEMIISFPRKFFIKWGFIALALCVGFIVFIFGYQGFMNMIGIDSAGLENRLWFITAAGLFLLTSFLCFFSRAQVVFSADALQRHYLLFGYQTLKQRSLYEEIERAEIIEDEGDVIRIILHHGDFWNIEGFPTRAHAESFVETLNSHLQEGLGEPGA